MKPTYNKKPLTLPQQLDHLTDKGLLIPDPDHATQILKRVGLYRFKGYVLPFKDQHGYQSKTSFDAVERLMDLDEALRLHILKAMPLIEVGIRQTISQYMVEKYGIRWYAKSELFTDNENYFIHSEFLEKAIEAFHAMPDLFVGHYRERYSADEYPPIWMIAETMTLGSWSKLFEALKKKHLKDYDAIAESIGIHKASTLASWLHNLTIVRNICAHHSRLYDRRFKSISVADNKRTKRLLKEYSFDDTDPDSYRVAPRLYALHRLTQTFDPGNGWITELKTLLSQYTAEELPRLGFRPGWDMQSEWERLC